MKIPISKPWIDEEERNAVMDVLRTDYLSTGPTLQKFENAMAEYIGVKHGISVNSGTSALHLCIRALGIEEGDEVITSPFSFIASSNCIVYERGVPVFVDVEEDSLNVNPDLMKEAATENTKALLPVHIFGQPCDMDSIMKLAKENNHPVIEDACEAIGATYKGKKVGTFGLTSTLAFYPNKQITTGEGGMIMTSDNAIAEQCRSLRNQGRTTDKEWLEHELLGYNYRLDDMSSALGLVQLGKVNEILSKRAQVAQWYAENLEEVDGTQPLPVIKDTERSWFVYIVILDEGIDRRSVIDALREDGIQARPYFSPIHLQPHYRKKFGFKEGDFPMCESMSKRTLALPFYTTMTKEEVNIVCKSLKESIPR